MSTAVVLAGGESRRMKQDKMELRLGKESFLESAVNRFSKCFETVWLSVADPGKYPGVTVPRLVDVYKGCGPMAGLHAALRNTVEDGAFLVAADLPFANPEAAKRIIELAGDADVCLLADERGRHEPLFAYYRKTILPHVEATLEAGNYKLAGLFDKVKVRVVNKEELGGFWDDKLLLNINYPEDYSKLMGEL